MKKSTQLIVIFSLTILTVLILYAFRTFDDNRLMSWDWVFSVVSIRRILLLLIPGSIAALVLAKSQMPGDFPAPFLFVLSFAAAALFWREPEMIVDASRYFTQAKHLELYGADYFLREWGKTIEAWTDLPLMPFIYGLTFRCLVEARIYVQIINTLLFSFTVVLTYLTGKILWDGETGFFGGMFMLGIPYIFTQVPLMMTDTPAMFFFSLAVFTFITAMQRGGLWVPAASAAISLAILSKYSLWLMLSLLIVIAAVQLFQAYRDAESISPGGYCGRAVIIFLAAACFAGFVLLLKHDVIASQIGLLLTYQKPGLGRWGERFVSMFCFQLHPVITAFAAFSIYVAWRNKDPRYLIASWLMLLIVVLQIKRSRYTIIAFPTFALMAAYGLKALDGRVLKRGIVFSAVVCSLTVAVFAYLPFLKQTSAQNLQLAGDFIDTLPIKAVEVVTLPRLGDDVNIAVSVPLLDLYTDKRICYDNGSNVLPWYAPAPEKIAVSPLRFTWIYKNPDYYSSGDCRALNASGGTVPGTAVAVISGEAVKDLPEGVASKVRKYNNSKVFSIFDDIFYHQTLVTVYY
ncbi:MAG: glycosyltransferase family 39 protein [Nitrospirae bacterium]|nr:glycosyltransferase family 39 protein [Nitrospirota bacterium]